MALYFVGDIQGCLRELKAVLARAKFNPKKDELWLAGDLVARGPDSLDTLRFIKSLGSAAKPVLGNHDLHLLAIHEGLQTARKKDGLNAILKANDRQELMEWLAQQPLLRKVPGEETYLSHAGLAPQWSVKTAIAQARFAEKRIAGSNRKKWLKIMYGNSPNNWQKAVTKQQKFRYTVNAFTRMRYCYACGSLEFSHKSSPKSPHKYLKPWYELTTKLNKRSWLIGHWATLMGECRHPNVYALDTGCVWGNHLTLLRWDDKRVFKQKAQRKT